MKEVEIGKRIEILVDKARDAVKSEDALRFSQAACNVAHALRSPLDSK